jgi:hypothetical protein
MFLSLISAKKINIILAKLAEYYKVFLNKKQIKLPNVRLNLTKKNTSFIR